MEYAYEQLSAVTHSLIPSLTPFLPPLLVTEPLPLSPFVGAYVGSYTHTRRRRLTRPSRASPKTSKAKRKSIHSHKTNLSDEAEFFPALLLFSKF